MRLAVIIATISLMATSAAAQGRPDVNDVVDRRCTTDACWSSLDDIDAGHYEPTRGTPDRRAVLSCISANDAIGRRIHNTSWSLTQREQSRGGDMSFDEAESYRAHIFNETYFVRQTLIRSIKDGDAAQCDALRDRAFGIIASIMRGAQ